MKSITFIFISLFSGAISGLILAGMNLIVVEPFIDKAIGFETARHIAAGEHIDMNQQNSYRLWQKSMYFCCRLYNRNGLWLPFGHSILFYR